MWSFAALVVLLATSASASVVTTPLTRLQSTGAYLKGASDADRARATFLKSRSGSGPTTVPATNLAFVQYTTRVGIGHPPTYYNLIVDTGSSNTFCGTGIPYVRTNTSIPTGQNVNVGYGSGFFAGKEYLDQVTLAPNLVIGNQSIGDALSFAGFQDVDGIVGVGPTDLTQGKLSPDMNATIPTVMDNLVSQKLIDKKILGVYFSPPTTITDINGALTYGGVDSSLYKGGLTYAQLTKTYPASLYWGINATCTYGHEAIIPTSTAGIVDTGTTQILLADDFFDKYLKAIPGAMLNPTSGLIEVPASSVSSMKDLTFFIAGQAFTLDVAAQLIPTDQATDGVPGKRYSVVSSMGRSSGEGLDFSLGQRFMERYYTAFDSDSQQVGFARTNNTFTKISS